MTELTETLSVAASKSSEWSLEMARGVLSSIAKSVPGASVDWEQGDEAWGRVVAGREVVAFVHGTWPIVITSPFLEKSVRQVSTIGAAAVVVASSFSERAFCVDKAVLERLCSRPLSENVDYRELSINDLWWATV